MTDPTDCELVGRRRIVEADPSNRAYLDPVEPDYVHVHETPCKAKHATSSATC